jgi:hypothetical protein
VKKNEIKKIMMALILTGVCLTIAVNAATDDRINELERKVNVLTREISDLKMGDTPTETKVIKTGMGPAASKIYSKGSGLSIGGYGDMLYNNYHTLLDNGSPSTRKDQIDFLRNVLYVGYKFNDNILFNTEIEVEHAHSAIGGEVEIEFAYVDVLLNSAYNFRSGMVLVPVGIVNEMHEPPTYFSTSRPRVETSIIPSTWSANGAGVFGEINEVLRYKVYLTDSLTAVTGNNAAVTGFSATGLGGGRQKGAKSLAENIALSARLDYEFMPGSLIGASFFSGGTTQGKVAGANGNVFLYDVHSRIQLGRLEIRALYAESTLSDADLISAAKGLSGTTVIGSKQVGSYLEVGYDVLPYFLSSTEQALIPFIRFENINTQAEVPTGGSADPANNRNYMIYGFSYLPISNIAFKLSFENETLGNGKGQDSINFASSYMF